VATATAETSIQVTWDSSAGAAGYTLSDNESLVTLDPSATGYSWTVTPGKYKCFHVRAFNSSGTSAWSSGWACTTTPGTWTGPAVPTNVAAAAISSSQISLTWTDNATTETGYRIQRWNGVVWATLVDGLPADTTSYVDSGLAASSTYYYGVCSYNSGGESCSNSVSAKTSP